MPRLSRVQRDAHQQLRYLANSDLLPEPLGDRLLGVLHRAIPAEGQVLFGVDSVSLLFNRLLAGPGHKLGNWLEHIYLVREPRFGLTFPSMMQRQCSVMALHDRIETSWGTSPDLFHPLSAREYYHCYHEIASPAGGILRACFAARGEWIAALEIMRL